MPWLTEGLAQLKERYPDDDFSVVYGDETLYIKCADCTKRLYAVDYHRRNVGNLETHCRGLPHVSAVFERLKRLDHVPRDTSAVRSRVDRMRDMERNSKAYPPERFWFLSWSFNLDWDSTQRQSPSSCQSVKSSSTAPEPERPRPPPVKRKYLRDEQHARDQRIIPGIRHQQEGELPEAIEVKPHQEERTHQAAIEDLRQARLKSTTLLDLVEKTEDLQQSLTNRYDTRSYEIMSLDEKSEERYYQQEAQIILSIDQNRGLRQEVDSLKRICRAQGDQISKLVNASLSSLDRIQELEDMVSNLEKQAHPRKRVRVPLDSVVGLL